MDISSVTGTSNIGGISQPVIGQRKIEHVVRLREGEANLMGGMLEDLQTKSLTGIPGLAQIPILKYLFGQTATEHSETETVFVLIPHIVRRQVLTAMNEQAIDVGTASAIGLDRKSTRLNSSHSQISYAVFCLKKEMTATETITSIILIKLIRVSLGTVRHPRRFKIVVIDIQITLKQMLRDFIGNRVNRAKKSGMVNITSSVNSRERSGINTILHELNPLFTIFFLMRDINSKNLYICLNSKATTQWRKTESANGVHLEGVASDNRSS